MKEKNQLIKEGYIKYKKAMEILNSDEYKEFIKQFDNTNNRFYFNHIEEWFVNILGEEEAEEAFEKCYPIYDAFNEKFKMETLSKFINVDFKTFSNKDCKMIVEWLNEELEKFTIDDVIFENVFNM